MPSITQDRRAPVGVTTITAVQPTSGATAVTTYGAQVVTERITLTNVKQSVVNGTEYQSTKIATLPAGRILVLGVTATLQQTTTSAIASTLNSGTGAVSLGTAAASSTTLSSTMVDLLPSTAFTSSTTINVAGTAVNAALAASAQFDGTATAKDVYLNSAYATTTDVDADATQVWNGTVDITYINLGDY